MASATDIASAEPEAASRGLASPAADRTERRRGRPGRRWGRLLARAAAPLPGDLRRRPFSPLTGRILAVNVLALAILAGGFLYLGKYQASLIDQQIESLKTEARIFAAALGEGAVLDSAGDGQVVLPDLARQMMRRLVEPTQTRARLFDVKGNIIADSRILGGPGAIQVLELPPPDTEGFLRRSADQVYDWVVGRFPHHTRYPIYRETALPRARDYAEVEQALRGETGAAIRRDLAADGLVFSVAVPVQRFKQVLGAVMLSTGSREIRDELRNVRLELLRIFGVALLVTVLLSVYLAGTIARPIRLLAAAA
jgi:two-component system sensor histidine kinase ChvG